MADNQVSDYKDIRERLSALRTIQMPAQRELEITSVLQREIEAHRQRYKGRRSRNSRRTLGWIGSVSAVVAVFVISIYLVNHRHFGNSVQNRTTAAAQSRLTVPVHYTSPQLQQVTSAAQAVGVTPWMPQRGLADDTLTIVKNGGKGILILDYKNIWVIEQTSPPASPQGVPKTTHLTIHNVPAKYIIVDNQSGQPNSFLEFQQGSTYITVENLWPRQAIPLQFMKAIGESFARVQ